MLPAKIRGCVGIKCYRGSIPHGVCADSRESLCSCWSVCPCSLLMAAGGQVGKQCQQCAKHTCSYLKPVSQPPRTWLDHQGLIHNLPSNEYFLRVLSKVVFDEILIWWLIFASDLLSSEIKKEWNFSCEAIVQGHLSPTLPIKHWLSDPTATLLFQSKIKGKHTLFSKEKLKYAKSGRLKALYGLFSLLGSLQ